VSKQTANGTDAVSTFYIKGNLTLRGVSMERIRIGSPKGVDMDYWPEPLCVPQMPARRWSRSAVRGEPTEPTRAGEHRCHPQALAPTIPARPVALELCRRRGGGASSGQLEGALLAAKGLASVDRDQGRGNRS
jgi:hypothetical protein